MRLFRLLFLTNCLVLALTASAQTITCSSNDMGRHYCRANTSNGVKLVYQRSGSACTMGVSWGYDNGGIWVDHGCRADFALGAGGGQGGNKATQQRLAYVQEHRQPASTRRTPRLHQRLSWHRSRSRQLLDQLPRAASKPPTVFRILHRLQKRAATQLPIRRRLRARQRRRR